MYGDTFVQCDSPLQGRIWLRPKRHIEQLGLNPSAIARHLSMRYKTVANAIKWIANSDT